MEHAMIQRQDGPGHFHRSKGMPLFADRIEAGRRLARGLTSYRGQRALVIALPRGGVPVASEVARELHGDLDILVARKLGAPGRHELAIGAVTADGTRYVNDGLARTLDVTAEYLERVTQRERHNAIERERRLRAELMKLDPADRIVILVDDGLATGATMRAAVWSLRRAHARKLIVAVPVGSAGSCENIAAEVDELVCPHRPSPFYAVGMHYRDFDAVSDDEVIEILRAHRRSTALGA
jgi:predicted phosphoribosyltransferase